MGAKVFYSDDDKMFQDPVILYVQIVLPFSHSLT